MRLSPRSIFFSVVALGLPFAVTAGWAVGTPAPAPAPATDPAGAGGIGAAPPKATSTTPTSSVVDWRPRTPKPVATVQSALPSLSGESVAVPAPSGAPPSIIVPSGSADPPLTVPPAPTPTFVSATPPSPSATGPSRSAGPVTSPSARRAW